MISRRNYYSITILMVAVLFLCMSINHLKNDLNDYAVNRYTETAENYPSKIHMYVPGNSETGGAEDPAAEAGAAAVPRDLVVCIGGKDRMSMQATAAWAAYTKRNIAQYPTLAAFGAAEDGGKMPEMLVLDPASVDWKAPEELDLLDQYLMGGTHLVFCGLPDVSVMESSRRVRELFGVQSVRAEETTVLGFYLREGFLLGGATFYLEKADPEAEEPLPGSEAFPGERTFPWYLPAAGTKVYMKGVPEDEELKAEDYPMVLWRNKAGDGYVFAVNGTFMEGQAGIGLLSAMSAEMHPYEIYPVVNAQNMVLADYPSLADENQEVLESIYSRPSVREVFQELVLPGVSAVLEKYGYKATYMMTPQFELSDGNPPEKKALEYFLKVFGEQAAETGLSGLGQSGAALAEKLEADQQFFQDVLGGYSFVSFYGEDLGEEEIMEALQADVLSPVRTVVRAHDEVRVDPVGFLSEEVTEQFAVDDGLEYTYRGDFLVRSMETALGYLNVSFDMSRVAYPETEEDQWENLSKTMASTIGTYGQRYPDFARTTAAECDAHIRRFLAMDYEESRTGDRIELQLEGVTGPVWFILRTHNETILDMDGGSWQKLEEGAYLVEAEQENVALTLGPADERYYR